MIRRIAHVIAPRFKAGRWYPRWMVVKSGHRLLLRRRAGWSRDTFLADQIEWKLI